MAFVWMMAVASVQQDGVVKVAALHCHHALAAVQAMGYARMGFATVK